MRFFHEQFPEKVKLTIPGTTEHTTPRVTEPS